MKGSLLELVLQFPKQQQLKQRATLQPSNIYIYIYVYIIVYTLIEKVWGLCT